MMMTRTVTVVTGIRRMMMRATMMIEYDKEDDA